MRQPRCVLALLDADRTLVNRNLSVETCTCLGDEVNRIMLLDCMSELFHY